MSIEELNEKIERRSASIAVIGLGYVGLPVAVSFALVGFNVLGVELRKERVEKINAGQNPIEGIEPGLTGLIRQTTSSRNFKAAWDYEGLADRDIILIDVETPVNEHHIPEYAALISALNLLGTKLKNGTLVIIESTIAPGTMKNVVLPLLERSSGKRNNIDFYLGNCPERVMPGKLLSNLHKMSRVIGGGSSQVGETMAKFYKTIVEADLDVTDWITAELVKTVENTYRDVQIAFANEVALICEEFGADVWKVREFVNKSPNRQMHLPGAGVGGHCIPKDPWLLVSALKEKSKQQITRIIPIAREINDGMPQHMYELVVEGLQKVNLDIHHATILVLGYAYLENSDDFRLTPSDVLIDLLKKSGAKVLIHDPHIKQFQGNVELMAKGCDCMVLMTAHDHYRELDLSKVKSLMSSPVIIDGRNFFSKTKAEAIGFFYSCIGKSNNIS